MIENLKINLQNNFEIPGMKYQNRYSFAEIRW